jgi:glycerate 2-kinase
VGAVNHNSFKHGEKMDKVLVKNYVDLGTSGDRKTILECLNHVFATISPSSAVEKSSRKLAQDIEECRRVFVIGFGKASLAMYEGIREKVKAKLSYAGIIVPEDQEITEKFQELQILRGNHPRVSELSVKSSESIIGHLRNLGKDDLVLVLISGGGSALFEIPEQGIDIRTLSSISDCMMKNGADIYELNRVRQIMSSVKGGKLAEILRPAKIRSMIISDVTGDDLSIIASGPLVKTSGNEDVRKIIESYSKKCKELGILEKIMSNKNPDKHEIGDVENLLVLKNYDYVEGVKDFLLRNKEKVVTWELGVTGEVSDVAITLTEAVRSMYSLFNDSFWLVFGGETTVNVTGKGKGGRNQELALRIMDNMEEDEKFTFASIGTDGIDGYSDAMGGITDNILKSEISRSELLETLKNSDSNTLLSKYKSAIVTGRTGTNVSDIMIMHYSGKMGGSGIDHT